jgi:DNA-binding CsgD family transcriptional regulator
VDETLDAGDAADPVWLPAGLFALIALLIALDLVEDALAGAGRGHLLVEGVVFALATAGVIVVLWRRVVTARREARSLAHALTAAHADAARWRNEAGDLLGGLGAAIDRQLAAWNLTQAEREVALLLLKGLSLKQIADLRATAERTARQQALAVYRKANVTGRAELSAFFLEDLLLPSSRDAAVDAATDGSTHG